MICCCLPSIEMNFGEWMGKKSLILGLLLLAAYILINFIAIYHITSYDYMLPVFKSSEHYQKVEYYQDKWDVPVWVGEFVWETQTPKNPLLIPAYLWTHFTDFMYPADDSMARIVNNEQGWSWSYWEYEKVAFGDERKNEIFSKYIEGSWKPTDLIPKLVVRGKEIQTEDGKPVILKGVDLPLKNLATYGILEANEETFQKLEGLGVNVVRIIINLDTTMPKEGDWDQKSSDTLKKALDLAEEHHIYVILNIHKYERMGFPKWYVERDKEFAVANWDYQKFQKMFFARQPPFEDSWDFIAEGWKNIINVSKGRNIVVGYDLLNEPGTGQDYELYEYLSAKIEPLDPGKIHFAETTYLFSGMTSEEKPKINNLVLSPHFYDVWRGNFFTVMFITSTLLPTIVVILFIILEAWFYLKKKR
jgi:hypothetical protein